jgi:hypothetical protein
MTCTICDECETVKHCMQYGCIPKVSVIKEKPVVYYLGVPQFYDWNDDERYPVATLSYVIGHPKLGNCRDVRTSKVLNVYFDGTIETNNTIYKPMASEGMGS